MFADTPIPEAVYVNIPHDYIDVPRNNRCQSLFQSWSHNKSLHTRLKYEEEKKINKSPQGRWISHTTQNQSNAIILGFFFQYISSHSFGCLRWSVTPYIQIMMDLLHFLRSIVNVMAHQCEVKSLDWFVQL